MAPGYGLGNFKDGAHQQVQNILALFCLMRKSCNFVNNCVVNLPESFLLLQKLGTILINRTLYV